jgi:hypothetical protein
MSIESTEFDAEVSLLVEEVPKLDAAMKNIIALLSGKSTLKSDAIPALELLSCARVVLKALNAHELVDVVEWGGKHPQGEQTAMNRITQLTHYKVVRALRVKSQDMGGKPSKLFGKSFILWSGCWKEVRAACQQEQPSTVPDAVFGLFMDTLELSLGLSKEEQSGLVGRGEEEGEVEGSTDATIHAAGTAAGAAGSALDADTVLSRLVSHASLAASPSSSASRPIRPDSALLPSADDQDLVWASGTSTVVRHVMPCIAPIS